MHTNQSYGRQPSDSMAHHSTVWPASEYAGIAADALPSHGILLSACIAELTWF